MAYHFGMDPVDVFRMPTDLPCYREENVVVLCGLPIDITQGDIYDEFTAFGKICEIEREPVSGDLAIIYSNAREAAHAERYVLRPFISSPGMISEAMNMNMMGPYMPQGPMMGPVASMLANSMMNPMAGAMGPMVGPMGGMPLANSMPGPMMSPMYPWMACRPKSVNSMMNKDNLNFQVTASKDGKRQFSSSPGKVFQSLNATYFGSEAFSPVQVGPCSRCEKRTSYTCQRCGAFYCSPQCQKEDWPTHQSKCNNEMPGLNYGGKHHVVEVNSPPPSEIESKSPSVGNQRDSQSGGFNQRRDSQANGQQSVGNHRDSQSGGFNQGRDSQANGQQSAGFERRFTGDQRQGGARAARFGNMNDGQGERRVSGMNGNDRRQGPRSSDGQGARNGFGFRREERNGGQANRFGSRSSPKHSVNGDALDVETASVPDQSDNSTVMKPSDEPASEAPTTPKITILSRVVKDSPKESSTSLDKPSEISVPEEASGVKSSPVNVANVPSLVPQEASGVKSSPVNVANVPSLVPQEAPSKESLPSSMSVHRTELPPAARVEKGGFVLLGGVKDNIVYLRPITEENQQILARITHDLAIFCNAAPALDRQPKKKEFLAAKFISLDNLYYRAVAEKRVSSGSPITYKVRFIDYGNADVVTSNDMKLISDDLAKFPSMSVEAILDGVPVKISKAAVDLLERYISEEIPLTVDFEDISMGVVLKDKDSGESLNAKLLKLMESASSSLVHTPSLAPTSTPAPALLPTPAPALLPTPAPALLPTPTPAPALLPTPTPAPALLPTPTPAPALLPTPTPAPAPLPTPAPAPLPTPAAAPALKTLTVTDIKSLEFPPENTTLKIIINSVESGLLMACPADKPEKLEQYIDLCTACEKYALTAQPFKPKENELCIVKWSDEAWYRATCLEPDSSPGKCSVMFLEYGNVDQVSIQDIRPFPGEFLQPPAMSTVCILHGGDLNDQQIDKLKSMQKDQWFETAIVKENGVDHCVLDIPAIRNQL